MTLILLLIPFVLEKAESLPVKNLNLLSDSQIWKTVNSAKLNKTQSLLNVTVETNDKQTVYNRAFTIINTSEFHNNPILKLTYATNASIGNPHFVFEMRSNQTISNQSSLSYDNILSNELKISQPTVFIGSVELGNTLGYPTTRSYQLPNIPSNSTEVRFYIITSEPTFASLSLKNATIMTTTSSLNNNQTFGNSNNFLSNNSSFSSIPSSNTFLPLSNNFTTYPLLPPK
jgi:hypothetical protein